MPLTALTCRDNAHVTVGDQGYLRVSAVLIKQHVSTTQRVMPLGASSEITFKPGTIYQAFTGVQLDPITSPLQLSVRTTKDAWKFGAQVLRVELIDGEIAVYFSTIEGFQFDRSQALFEVGVLSPQIAKCHEALYPRMTMNPMVATVTPDPAVTVETGEHKAEPGLQRYEEKRHINGAPQQQAAQAVKTEESPSEAEARISDWLNAPDERGKVVAEDTGKPAHPLTLGGSVSGALAPSAEDIARAEHNPIDYGEEAVEEVAAELPKNVTSIDLDSLT